MDGLFLTLTPNHSPQPTFSSQHDSLTLDIAPQVFYMLMTALGEMNCAFPLVPGADTCADKVDGGGNDPGDAAAAAAASR